MNKFIIVSDKSKFIYGIDLKFPLLIIKYKRHDKIRTYNNNS